MQIETIRELVEANRIIWTQHAKDRIKQRKILKDDVERGILCGEIIEDYPDSYPFPSCLIWTKVANKRTIHVVVGFDGMNIYIISVYIPDKTKFEGNFKIRRSL